MAKKSAPVLISGAREDLCLGFANTLSWRGRDTPAEALRDFAGLLRWLESTGGLGAGATAAVAEWSLERPKQSARAFAEAIALREIMFRMFSAVAAGNPADARDFAGFSAAVARAPPRMQLERTRDGYGWRIEGLQPRVADLLAPVLWSAADLMLDAPHSPVRRCANQQCLWLFVDGSKNGTRRWCDMASCGNRAKAERHYRKSKVGR